MCHRPHEVWLGIRPLRVKDTIEAEDSRPLWSPFGRKDTVEVEGFFFGGEIYGENFFVKGVEKFFWRQKIGGEMIGRFRGKKNLRHTDGVGRGNVRSTMNDRKIHFADNGNWGGVRKERRNL